MTASIDGWRPAICIFPYAIPLAPPIMIKTPIITASTWPILKSPYTMPFPSIPLIWLISGYMPKSVVCEKFLLMVDVSKVFVLVDTLLTVLTIRPMMNLYFILYYKVSNKYYSK